MISRRRLLATVSAFALLPVGAKADEMYCRASERPLWKPMEGWRKVPYAPCDGCGKQSELRDLRLCVTYERHYLLCEYCDEQGAFTLE